MCRLTLLVEGSFGTAELSICVPFDLVRDLPQLMNEGNRGPKKPAGEVQKAIRSKLARVPVELTLELGRALLPARRILQLQPGDAVVLDATTQDSLTVRVNDRPKLQGRPVVSQGNIAVRLEGGLPYDA
jgi:flagellar motor switch protein FliM